MTRFDKNLIFEEMLKKLQENLSVLIDAAFEAKEASTNEESKAENKYDTRGLEASYLASGQAKRAQKLQEEIFNLQKVDLKDFHGDDKVGVGALVELEINGAQKKHLFLLPVGGVEVKVDQTLWQSINIQSPLGQNILNQSLGFDFVLNGNEYEILEIY